MRVNWSRRALAELDTIADFIEKDDPYAAERVVTRIVDEISSLSNMAERGRYGRVPGTRELLFTSWPYFAVYRVIGEDVRILHIRHTSRRWPVRE